MVGVGWIFGKLGAMDGLVRLHHRLAYSSPSSFVSSIRCRLTYFSVPLIIPCAPPNNSCKGFQLLKKAGFQYKVSNITMWPGSSSFELTFEKLLPETNSLAICACLIEILLEYSNPALPCPHLYDRGFTVGEGGRRFLHRCSGLK